MSVAPPTPCSPGLWRRVSCCVCAHRNPAISQPLPLSVQFLSGLSLSSQKVSPWCWRTVTRCLFTLIFPVPLWWRWKVGGSGTDPPTWNHFCPLFRRWCFWCPSRWFWWFPPWSPPWRLLPWGGRRFSDLICRVCCCCLISMVWRCCCWCWHVRRLLSTPRAPLSSWCGNSTCSRLARCWRLYPVPSFYWQRLCTTVSLGRARFV